MDALSKLFLVYSIYAYFTYFIRSVNAVSVGSETSPFPETDTTSSRPPVHPDSTTPRTLAISIISLSAPPPPRLIQQFSLFSPRSYHLHDFLPPTCQSLQHIAAQWQRPPVPRTVRQAQPVVPPSQSKRAKSPSAPPSSAITRSGKPSVRAHSAKCAVLTASVRLMA
jgi:hypothetical protein